MASPLTRAFDMLSESAVGLVVFIVVLVFGSILVAQLTLDREAEYANCGTGTNQTGCGADVNISREGQQGILDMSGYTGLIVLAIVFVIILALVFLIKRQGSNN